MDIDQIIENYDRDIKKLKDTLETISYDHPLFDNIQNIMLLGQRKRAYNNLRKQAHIIIIPDMSIGKSRKSRLNKHNQSKQARSNP